MKYLLFILFVILFAVRVEAAITFDAQSDSIVDNTTTTSYAHSVGGGCTNPIVIVSVGSYVFGGGVVTAMTIGGTSATFISSTTSESRRLEMWYRKGVSTGSNTIAVTMDTTLDVINVSARSYCGVDQTTPLGTATTTYDPGNGQPTINVASTAGDWVIDAILSRKASALTVTVGAGQTQRDNAEDFSTNVYILAESDEVAIGSPTTMSWTQTGGDDSWSMIGVALKPAAGGAPTIVRRRAVIIQ